MHSTETGSFYGAYRKLYMGLCKTAGAIIEFEEMVDCIEIMEKTYREFFASISKLLRDSGINISNRKDLLAIWEEWRKCHNLMFREYEKIKRDSRIPKLFRPGKKSRWGGILGPEDVTDVAPNLRL